MSGLRALVRSLVPSPVLAAWRARARAREHARNRGLGTEQVFTEIYARNGWGGAPGTYNSGTGSSDEAIVAAYVECVGRELERIDRRDLVGVDLGCGDYAVGRRLAPHFARYIGVDIVRGLVEHNRAAYGSERVAFEHRDLVADPLPAGDVCFVRQVFQHLSNAQIAAILPKLRQYRWCFVTEHQPSPGRLRHANVDKPHGGDIRVFQGSGVYLEHPPFALPPAALRTVLEVPGHAFSPGIDPGVIRTYLITSD